MKTLKKIIFLVFILLSSIHLYALNEKDNDDLICEMEQNPKVISMIRNVYKIGYIRHIVTDMSQLDALTLLQFNEMQQSIQVDKSFLENQFPSFKERSDVEKQEILVKIAQQSVELTNYLQCLSSKVAVWFACAGVTYGGFALIKYKLCTGTALLPSIAGFLNAADLYTQATREGIVYPELVSCLTLTLSNIVSVSLIASCTNDAIKQLMSCSK